MPLKIHVQWPTLSMWPMHNGKIEYCNEFQVKLIFTTCSMICIFLHLRIIVINMEWGKIHTYIHYWLSPKGLFKDNTNLLKILSSCCQVEKKKITNTNTNTIQIFNYKYSSNSFKIESSWKLISEQLFILYMLQPLSSKGL